MTAYDSAHWGDLFVGSAGASAALTGLVFVAVSINIEPILRYPGLPDRALETVALLLGVVVVSVFGLVPDQGRTALGLELLGTGLVWSASVGALFVRGAPYRASGVVRAVRAAVTALGTLPFVVAGVSVLAAGGGGLYWTVGGIVGGLVGGVMNAWVLLVEIRR